jgi:hypothetical protein
MHALSSKEKAMVRLALTMIGAAVAAVCALSFFALLLFFAPLAGGAGAVVLLIGVSWLLVYMAVCAMVLTWAGLTRVGYTLADVGRRVGRRAYARPSLPTVARAPQVPRSQAHTAGRHWHLRHRHP